ncbi:hypothetical protein [Phytoactinopolyspora limicola]|uniref:hypothetical protein n=1 Tax=Phytoactinopolyspora limicola TaxID=2715536 RepID=UPI001408AA04|nr:hypothetical protein [Phytoactinopolyspora limicola]
MTNPNPDEHAPPECHRHGNDRAITDQHTPDCDNPHTCTGCLPCPQRHCTVDQRRHLHPKHDGPRTCTTCLNSTRTQLGSLRALAITAQHEITASRYRSPQAPRTGGRSPDTPTPGGDALAMLTAGHNGTVVYSRTGNRDHAADHQPDDPDPVLAVLASWEDDWRKTRGEPAAGPPSFHTVLAYLTRHLDWAAQHHDAFPDFSADVARIRRRLLSVVGDSPAPERAASASCTECGSRLVAEIRDPKPCHHSRRPQRRRDRDGVWEPLDEFEHRVTAWEVEHARCDQGGREDLWVCDDCGTTYTPAQYFIALAARLEEAS